MFAALQAGSPAGRLQSTRRHYGKPICDNCVRVSGSCVYEKVLGEISGKPVRIRKKRHVSNGDPSASGFITVSSSDIATRGIEILRRRAMLSLPGSSSAASSTAQGEDVVAIPTTNFAALGEDELPGMPWYGLNADQLVPTIGSTWQAAPSTSLNVGAKSGEISLTDVELHCFYLQVTSTTVPYASLSIAPWRDLTFQIGCEALESFRNVLAPKGTSGFPIVPGANMCAVFATTVLLIVHTWSSPLEDLDTAIYSSLVILTGSKDLVRAFIHFPEFRLITKSIWIERSFWTEVYETYNVGEYRFEGLEMLLPGVDIYSQDAWAPGRAIISEGSDQVVDLLSLHCLAAVMTIMTSPRRITRRVLSVVIRVVFHWAAGCDPTMLAHVNLKDERSYVLVAHYFAVWWRMRHLAISFLAEPPQSQAEEFGIGNKAETTWWLEETPRMICEGILNRLGPNWAEPLRWVEETIHELAPEHEVYADGGRVLSGNVVRVSDY
ncbi:hypothetical protein TWF192_007109 [Orbilia oligospora]|uniref:Transcription factor domain-containing protein n=1 Tax=Orbilia oligospora TaxID=2813651 RepID=A0A6G1ML98_ORBOL|nr:hypothetical protein TWF191_000286 [Orbilia oligospora]KAF3262434.1 hypothetical protein TWF192_007109 [Orbilia oligospora]